MCGERSAAHGHIIKSECCPNPVDSELCGFDAQRNKFHILPFDLFQFISASELYIDIFYGFLQSPNIQ